MSKKYLDKYYTPRSVVKAVIKAVEKELKPLKEFNRIIEPSAGDGAFLKELPENVVAYDIAPDCEGVIKGDYLLQEIIKTDNSLVIGNPPFGVGGALIKNFIKKSLEHSNWVAFVLPLDWYQRKIQQPAGIKLYKSYKLPEANYSGVKLKCCFNIYTRGKEAVKKIEGVEILKYKRKTTTEQEEKEYINLKADYRIVAFGGLRILKDHEPLRCQELKITFRDKKNFRPILEKFLSDKLEHTISKRSVEKGEIESLIFDTYPELRKK